MEIINFYDGFEGNPEIILREKSGKDSVLEVRMLEFHFNELLSLFPLGQYDQQSVLYSYFRGEGWHDGEWECKLLETFFDELSLIEEKVPNELLNIYLAIKKILKSSISNDNKLFIELD